jgi:glycosyltransferase involved in cell wall biosynthesis
MARISTIIPLYNQKRYVRQAIASILKQTYKDMEIIVVDDGSTDNPDSILRNYQDEIRVIKKRNGGLASARNIGIKESTGEYLQFLDADDYLHKDKLRLQLELMTDTQAMVSYCEITQYDQINNKSHLTYIGKLNDIFPNLYNIWLAYPLPIHSLMFKNDIFAMYGNFPEDLTAAEDRYFLSMLALNNVEFSYFPYIGGSRRMHELNMNKNRLHIYENMIKYYRKLNQYKPAIEYIENKYNYSCYQMMRANITYMYLADIAGGTPPSVRFQIKKLLKNEGIRFFFRPIPQHNTKLKAQFLYLSAYIRRYGRLFLKTI